MKSSRIKKVFNSCTFHIFLKVRFVKASFFNRLTAVIILLSFTGLLFADDFGTQLPGGFDKRTLGIYLDRADLADSREEWQRIAEYGIEVVTVKWEGEYLFAVDASGGSSKGTAGEGAGNSGQSLSGDVNQGKDGTAGSTAGAASDTASGRNGTEKGILPASFSMPELKSSLDKIVAGRFKKWLINKFFNEKVILNPGIIYKEIRKANREYLFETGEDGKIKLDPAGDPVLKTKDNLDGEASAWNMLVKKGINDALNSMESKGAAWQAEILNLLKNDRFISTDEDSLTGYNMEYEFTSRLSLAKESYKRELNRIFNMEERRFTAKRKRDQFSLRKKSEGKSAGVIAKDLIKDAKEGLSAGLKSLRRSIEGQANPAETGSGEISAEKWREDFRRVFDSGINRWKKAERELLFNRMEWEKRAGRAFSEGEKEWEKAYGELVKAKTEWQTELNTVVNKGLVRWQDKEDSLISAIEGSKEELLSGINDRTKNLSGQLDGLIDIYLKSAGMINQADKSIEFWEDKLKETPSDTDYKSRIKTWEDIKTKYAAYKEEAGQKIVSLYGITISDGTPAGLSSGNPLAVDFTGGFGGDVLLNRDGLGDEDRILLDNYQAELIRAKALKEYWDRQYDIARSVYEYAEDTSSGRPTGADTEREYRQALSEFQEAGDKYQEAVDKLKGAGKGLGSIKQRLSEVQEELKNREKDLEEAQEKYNIKLAILKTKDGSYFKKQISAYYENLFASHGFNETSGEDKESISGDYVSYFTASRLYELDSLYSSLNGTVYELVKGKKGAGGFLPLEELKEKAESAEGWRTAWKKNPDNPDAVMAALDIKIDDSIFYPRFNNEFNRLKKLGSGEITYLSEAEKNAFNLMEKLKIEALGDQASGFKQDDFTGRLDEIKLLTAGGLPEWLNEIGLDLAGYDEIFKDAGLGNAGIYTRLKYLADSADGRYYADRAEEERAVLTEAENLIESIFGDREEIQDYTWLNNSEVEQILAGSDSSGTSESKARQPDRAALSMIIDRLKTRRTGLKALKEEIYNLKSTLDDVSEFFSDKNNLVLGTSKKELRELIGKNSYLKEFFSGKSFLILQTPGVFMETEEEKAYGQADISSLVLKELTGRRNKEKKRFSLLKRYGKNIPGIREELESDAVRAVNAVLEDYGVGSIGSDNTVRINKPEKLWKSFTDYEEAAENALNNSGADSSPGDGTDDPGSLFTERFSSFYSDLNKASANLPGYVKSELNEFADSAVDYYILKAFKSGIKIDNSFNGNKSNGSDSPDSEIEKRIKSYTDILNSLKELKTSLNTSIYNPKQSETSRVKTLINAYSVFKRLESAGLSDSKTVGADSSYGSDSSGTETALKINPDTIKSTIVSQVSLRVAKKIFTESSAQEFAGTEIGTVEQAFDEYLESSGLEDNENDVLELFRESIINESYSLIRLSVLISGESLKNPSDKEKVTAGIYTLTNKNIDTVYNVRIKKEEADYIKTAYRIFSDFKNRWTSAGLDEEELFNYLKKNYAKGSDGTMKFMENAEELYRNLIAGSSTLKDISLNWLDSILPDPETAKVYHYSWELKLKLNLIADGKVFKDIEEELKEETKKTLDTWNLEDGLQSRVMDFIKDYRNLLSGQDNEIDVEKIDEDINGIIESTSGYDTLSSDLKDVSLKKIAVIKVINDYYRTVETLSSSGTVETAAFEHLVSILSEFTSGSEEDKSRIIKYGESILAAENDEKREELFGSFLKTEQVKTGAVTNQEELLYALSLEFGQRVLNDLGGEPVDFINTFLKEKDINGYAEYLSALGIFNGLKGMPENRFEDTLKTLTLANTAGIETAAETVKQVAGLKSILPALFYTRLSKQIEESLEGGNDLLKSIKEITGWYFLSAGIAIPGGISAPGGEKFLENSSAITDRNEELLYSSAAGTENSGASTAFLLKRMILQGSLIDSMEEKYIDYLTEKERNNFYLFKNAVKLKKRYVKSLEHSVFDFVSEESKRETISRDPDGVIKAAEIIENGTAEDPVFIVSMLNSRDTAGITEGDLFLSLTPLNDNHTNNFIKYLLEDASGNEKILEKNLNRLFYAGKIGDKYRILKGRFNDGRKNYRAYLGDYFQDQDTLKKEDTPQQLTGINEASDYSDVDKDTVDYYLTGTKNEGSFYENEYLEAVFRIKERITNTSLSLTTMFSDSSDNPENNKEGYQSRSERDYFKAYSDLDKVEDTRPELAGITDNMLSYREEYQKILSDKQSVSFYKEKIALIGMELNTYLDSKDYKVLKQAVKDDEKKIDDLGNRVEDSRNNWAVIVSEYESAEGDYNLEFKNMEDARKNYKSANFKLDKAEAVNEYAGSAYTGKKEDESPGNLSDPRERLAYTFKKKREADAAYEALSSVDTEKREDFGIKDNEYQTDYNDYVRSFKNAVWFDKILSLAAEQTAKQAEKVEEAKKDYDDNLEKNILSANGATGLSEAQPGFADFYTLKLNQGGIDRFAVDSSVRGNFPGENVVKVIKGKDSDGNTTKKFADSGTRDMYFYMGGSVENLEKESIGFTDTEAEEAYKEYKESAKIPGISETVSYQADRKEWTEGMAGLLKNKSPGDAVTLFKNWSLAHWYYKYTISGKYMENASDKTKEYWKGIHSNLELASEMHNMEAIIKHVTGKGYESTLKTKGKEAYESVTGNSKENELFRFYAFSEEMGLDLDRGMLGKYGTGMLRKYALDEMNKVRDSKKTEGLRSLGLYAGMIAAAAIASVIPIIGSFIASALIVTALIVYGVGMVSLIKAGLAKNGINTVIGDWDKATPREIDLRLNGPVTDLVNGINRYTGLAQKVSSEEKSLSKMEGKGEGGDTVSDDSLKAAIKEALKKKGLSLKSFLGIGNESFKGFDDDRILTELLGGYSKRIGDSHRKNVSSLLLNYKGLAEYERDNSLDRLETTVAGLKERQKEKQGEYLKALKDYDEYVEKNMEATAGSGEIAASDSQSLPDSQGKPAVNSQPGGESTPDSQSTPAQPGSSEESLYRELVTKAQAAYEESVYIERTHRMRMLETSMGLADDLDSTKYESLKGGKRKILGEIKNDILELNAERYGRYVEVKENEWNLMWENLKFRKEWWQDSIKTIMRRGNAEWNRAERKLKGGRRGWVRKFQKEYSDKSYLWNEKYGNFLNAKSLWVNDTAKKTVLAGRENILKEIGESADGRIRKSGDTVIGDIEIERPESGEVIKGLTGGTLTKLLEEAQYKNNLIESTDTMTDGMIRLTSMGESGIINLVAKFQSEDKKEIEKEILYITAAKALKSIKEAAKDMEDNIGKANEGVKKSLDDTFTGAGYKVAGGVYAKDILTDSTVLGGEQWEHEEVSEYKYFMLPGGLSLDPEKIAEAGNLKNLSAEEIQAVIDRAMGSMKAIMEKIFGKKDAPKRYRT
ncbi:MAG: hypothetical protein GXP33_02945, partial [Spirochaetes bacterium]|nr:hypothetical protein [Spirochaetota bacterium]